MAWRLARPTGPPGVLPTGPELMRTARSGPNAAGSGHHKLSGARSLTFPVFRCKTMRSPFILTSALAVLLALVGVRTAAVQESRFCLPGNAALQGMTKAPAPVFRPGPAGEPSNLSAGPGMAVGSLKTVG